MNNTSSVSSTSTVLDYHGFLNVKLKHKGKVFPFTFVNNGTKFLFDTITKFLAGYEVSDCVPKYFDFQTKTSSGEYVSCLQSTIRLTGAVYGDMAQASSSDGRVMYNAIVTYEDKSSRSALVSPRVVLKDSSNNVIAVIQNENLHEVWESIVKGTEAVIEWTMVFKNQGGSQ